MFIQAKIIWNIQYCHTLHLRAGLFINLDLFVFHEYFFYVQIFEREYEDKHVQKNMIHNTLSKYGL